MTHRILVDCDGVLANFIEPFLAIANRLAGTSYTEADVKEWDMDRLPGFEAIKNEAWAEVGDPGFARNMPLYQGAQEGMRRLADIGEVFIVTAPLWLHKEDESRGDLHGQTFCWDRVKWLRAHFGIPATRVIFAYHKELVEGDVLIDDKVENVEAWIKAHGTKKGTSAILWSHPYNKTGQGRHPKVMRTNDWNEAGNFILAHKVQSQLLR